MVAASTVAEAGGAPSTDANLVDEILAIMEWGESARGRVAAVLARVGGDKAAALEVILTNAGVHAQSIGELVDEKAGFRVEVINGGQA